MYVDDGKMRRQRCMRHVSPFYLSFHELENEEMKGWLLVVM